MVEDFLTYAVRNDRMNKEVVLHRAWLLLWAAVEESGDGVKLTATRMVIQIARLGLGPQRESCSLLQVAQVRTGFGIGLGLVHFEKRRPRTRDRANGPCNACGNVAKRRRWPTDGLR